MELSTIVNEDSRPQPLMASVESLEPNHKAHLVNAVMNVLSTDIAKETLAQIVDGAPIASVEQDRYGGSELPSLHPLYERHQNLCPGAMDRLLELSAQFRPDSLKLAAEVMFLLSFPT